MPWYEMLLAGGGMLLGAIFMYGVIMFVIRDLYRW